MMLEVQFERRRGSRCLPKSLWWLVGASRLRARVRARVMEPWGYIEALRS